MRHPDKDALTPRLRLRPRTEVETASRIHRFSHLLKVKKLNRSHLKKELDRQSLRPQPARG